MYGYDLTDIQGYPALPAKEKEMFKEFYINFLNRWGFEAREIIEPLSVAYVIDSPEPRPYILFEYKQYGRSRDTYVYTETEWG